jgi:hypothetical protein
MLNSFSDYKAYTGNAADAYVVVLFTFRSRAVEITALNQAITIRFQLPDGATYGDEITYDPFAMAFPFGPIPWQTGGFMVKNATPGINGSYQIVEYV